MADAFITAADLGNHLDLDLTSDQAASDAIQAACDICRTISEQTFNEVTDDIVTLDGTGGDTLSLPQLPVTAVSEVVENDTTLDPDDYRVTNDGVLVKPRGWWAIGRQNITVTYDHGYPVEDIPRDVWAVALHVAARLYSQGGAISEQLGVSNVTYAVAATDLTAGEKAILRKHRRT